MGETATLDGAARSTGAGAFLLVIEAGSSTVFPLQPRAAVTIGRAPDAELRIDHASVSRHHARIVNEGELRITDLGSHNGTRVNGQPLDRPRTLTTGDVVAIGEAILVVHREIASEHPRVSLDEASWRRRLADEVARSQQFQRALAVLAIEGGTPSVGTALRSVDVTGLADDGGVLALLPEADALSAHQLAERVVRASSPEVRVGIALCPSDANDADSLVLAARAAARVARPGGAARPIDAAERRVYGDRTVLLCHPAMVRVFELLRRLAASDLPVLVVGETGVGKENAALAVHAHSRRASGPFVAINCAAIADGLIESQLFGHDKGAFTGAVAARPGVFESAAGGTLFLDEIGELSPASQAKLLRVLETKRVTRMGEAIEREVDVRIVAATHRVVEDEVAAGRFRQDLYFRLGAARVHLLPLRDRRCEIPILFREFVDAAARAIGREPPQPTPALLQRLLAHTWPGNVRELKHVADYVTATVEDDRIELDDLPADLAAVQSLPAPPLPAPLDPPPPMQRLADELDALERLRITEALARTNGVKTRAAALIGVPIRTFNMKVKQYGL